MSEKIIGKWQTENHRRGTINIALQKGIQFTSERLYIYATLLEGKYNNSTLCICTLWKQYCPPHDIETTHSAA